MPPSLNLDSSNTTEAIIKPTVNKIYYFLSLLFSVFLLGPAVVFAQTDEVLYVHNNLDDYSLTCLNPPKVNIIQQSCGAPPSSTGLTTFDPVVGVDTMGVETFINLSNARLGGFGPDSLDLQSLGSDGVARYFPFSALADRPLTKNPTREAFRSFWRVTNFQTQLNAKAKFIRRFQIQIPPMVDADIAYQAEETDATPPDTNGIGKLVAEYMNSVIDGVAGNPNIRLLSPAFNLTSRFTPPLVREMRVAGARFSALAGCSGNTYTSNGRTAYQWYTNFLNETNLGSACRSFVFTEYGDLNTFDQAINNRNPLILQMQNDFNAAAADTKIRGIIYFNAMGGNGSFSGHRLSGQELEVIISDNAAKAGVNSAQGMSSAFPQEVRNYSPSSRWVLSIAYNPSDAASTADFVRNANALGMTPVVRICSGNTCAFSDPAVYVSFLQTVATAGPFYAIAGPNEPEAELWLGGSVVQTTTLVPDNVLTIKLSDLINKLPNCLKTYPVNCDNPIRVYQELPETTRLQYDALLPFSYDSVRGYIANSYLDSPSASAQFDIKTEDLEYVQGTKEALNENTYGVANELTPNWLNQKRDQSLTSDGWVPALIEKINPLLANAIVARARSIWGSDRTEDNPKEDVFGCYTHTQGLKLIAPKTNPEDYANSQSPSSPTTLDQSLRVPVKITSTPNSNACPVRNNVGVVIGYETQHTISADDSIDYRQLASFVRSSVGRNAVVLNNPKMTDVSRLLTEPKDDKNLSFTAQMLPSNMTEDKKYHDTPLLAQGATYSASGNSTAQISAQAGGESGTEGPIPRKGGQAHTDFCVLRNYQLMPGSLQRGDVSSCEDSQSFASSTNPISNTPYTGNGSCTIPTSGFCSPSNPDMNYSSLFGANAGDAAQICSKESNGNPRAINDGCLRNPTYNTRVHTADYSIGLFQINLLAHPNAGFLSTAAGASLSAATGGRPCYTAFTNYRAIVAGNFNLYCEVGDQNLLNVCINWFQNPVNNAAYASYMSQGGNSFGQWSTAAVCGIN